MDKNAIKKYAIWARRELIARVSQRAAMYEITAEGYGDADAVSVHGRILSQEEKNQRRALITKIKEKGYEQVMEEVAYTWFNRFSALRFMEVNGYLPSHVRVFTDDENNFKPQIMTEAINLEMDGLDMQKVFAFKTANDDDGLFKYLIIIQCNALSVILPGMFEKISDYTEILFPDNLLREGSVVEQMVSMIPEEDWTDQVQIIGWLYQYYVTEQNEIVYDGTLSRNTISKELIPAATTIYTPDWAVRYMVDNSLGKLWMEGHPESNIKESLNYYINNLKPSQLMQNKLVEIANIYQNYQPEQIRCIDICAGSGHILCYMFDVLMMIYEDYGYSRKEAVAKIIDNNLWGLDIDKRAVQLSYFAIMMKARAYDRNFFKKNNKFGDLKIPQPKIYAITESNNINESIVEYIVGNNNVLKKIIKRIIAEMDNGTEFGSILKITPFDINLVMKRLDEIENEDSLYSSIIKEEIRPLFNVARTLTQKYSVIVTNPPYLGSSRFNDTLATYVMSYYKEVKNDLSMAMFKQSLETLSEPYGFVALITTSSWMFLSSFETFRKNVIENYDFESIVDFGTELFEGKVGHNPIVAWVNRNCYTGKRFTGIRLVNYCYSRRDEKQIEFFNERNRYYPLQNNFKKIPSSPMAYWLSEDFFDAFSNETIKEIAKPRQGLATGCNDMFIRLWHELDIRKIKFDAHSIEEAVESCYKWFPYNKGGEYRKWYGNNDYVVNWENNGFLIRNFKNKEGKLRSRPQNTQFYFKECISWSLISSGTISFRYKSYGNIFDIAGMSCFANKHLLYLLGLCNSTVAIAVLKVLAPTINYQAGDIGNIPVIIDTNWEPLVERLVDENIKNSKIDWDSFEISWDFKRHPLVTNTDTLLSNEQILLKNVYEKWAKIAEERFSTQKNNEERLNQIFINIYKLQRELKPIEEEKEVTIRKSVLSRDIRSLISYSVGCMFGRYSLDQSGLVLAGQDFKEKFVYSSVPSSVDGLSGLNSLNLGKGACYLKRDENDAVRCSFEPDEDGIIPICDDEYFNDDIVGRFVKFVEVVYGKETLEENLQFIANALGGSGTSREIIRNYFINSFYADHLKVYQKRPIYWLFDSGKKNGFKCLVYMHRYQPDTIARIRTDYVHEQQSRYRTAIADLQSRIDNAVSTSDRVKLSKKLKTIQEQDEELRFYEEKIHHLADQMIKIDLDDGVKVNYAKFQDVLAKIK